MTLPTSDMFIDSHWLESSVAVFGQLISNRVSDRERGLVESGTRFRTLNRRADRCINVSS